MDELHAERPPQKVKPRHRTKEQEHEHYLKRKARVGVVHGGKGEAKPGRPFLCYDGEGSAEAYWLLGNEHEYIYNAEGLSTLACLEFLTKGEADGSIRIFYAIHYDVNQIARDLPRAAQNRLFSGEWVVYRGFSLRYYPHHRLELSRPGRRWTFDDVGNYFHAPLIDVAEKMGLDIPAIIVNLIKKGKAERHKLAEWPAWMLQDYNQAECVVTRLVMEHFRAALQWPADDVLPAITPTSWMGPGSVASALLRKLPDFRPAREYRGGGMVEAWAGGYPVEVQQAAERAFFGGRVELYKVGHASPIYCYDLHSAYPSAMRGLWTRGRWTRVKPGCRVKLSGIYDVEWDLTGANPIIGPFPWRDKDGEVCYPAIGRGYYWGEEIANVERSSLIVRGGYELHDIRPSPLAPIVERLYELRAQFKAAGDPRELGVKAALVALYGKLCQRHGDATWRNLAMAGWVTASVRATMLRAMLQAPESVIACLTDSIHATVPLKLDIGDGLGQWSERRVESGDYLLHSIYRLSEPGARPEERTGGLQVAGLDWPKVIDDIAASGKSSVHVSTFVGHLQANSSRVYAPHRLKILRPTDRTSANQRTIDPFGESRREVEPHNQPAWLDAWSYATTPLYSLPGEDAHTIVESYPPGGFVDRFEDEEVESYEFE